MAGRQWPSKVDDLTGVGGLVNSSDGAHGLQDIFAVRQGLATETQLES